MPVVAGERWPRMERVESEISRPPEQVRAAISIFRADNCKLRIPLSRE